METMKAMAKHLKAVAEEAKVQSFRKAIDAVALTDEKAEEENLSSEALQVKNTATEVPSLAERTEKRIESRE